MSVVLKGVKANKTATIRLDSYTKPSLFYYFNDAYIDDARLLYERLVKRRCVDSLYLIYVSASMRNLDPFFNIAKSRIYWTGPSRYLSSLCSVFYVTTAPLFLVWGLGQVLYAGVSASKATQSLADCLKIEQDEEEENLGLEESPVLAKHESATEVVKCYISSLSAKLLDRMDKTHYAEDRNVSPTYIQSTPPSASKALARNRSKSPCKLSRSPDRFRVLTPVLEGKRKVAS